MKNTKHPSFIIGIISILLFIIGAAAKSYGYNDFLVWFAVGLGAIHWVWSIYDVATRPDMKPFQKRFWLIVVVAAPAIGGLIFYILHQKENRLTT